MMEQERILARTKYNWERFKEYYESKAFNPYIPEKASWRHWRVRSADGVMRKIKRTITNKKSLLRAIIDYCAVDVYYSTACFLSPKNKGSRRLTGKKGSSYEWADNLIVDSDFYIDLDARGPEDQEGIESARQDAVKAIKNSSMTLRYVQFTGGRGFGVDFVEPQDLPRRALERASHLKRSRNIYINKLLRNVQLTSLDKDTTTDVMRVRRLPGTINSKTGKVAMILTTQALQTMTAGEIIANTHSIGDQRLVKPATANDRPNPAETKGSRRGNPPKEPPAIPAEARPRPRASALFITSKVVGTKDRHVIFLRYTHRWDEEIRRLQQVYRLGPVYEFTTGEETWYATARAFPIRRADKVYAASKSTNKTSFLKYRKSYLPLNIEPVKVHPGEERAPLSKAHQAHYHRLLGIPENPPGTLEFTKQIYNE